MSLRLACYRPMAPLLRAHLSLLLCLCACVGDRAQLTQRKDAALAGGAGAELEAAAAHVDAAMAARPTSAVDGVELRVRGQAGKASSTSPAEDALGPLEVGARLNLKSPFEAAASARARDAEVAGAVAQLEGVALQQRALRCVDGAQQQAWRERRALYELLAFKLGKLTEWNRDWRRGGSLDELTAARFELEAGRLLLSREPRPLPPALLGGAPDAKALPEVAAPRGRLARGAEVVASALSGHHPAQAARAAAQGRAEALEAQAFHASLPWLRFVEVGFSPNATDVGRSVGARLALEVPLGAPWGEPARQRAEGLSEQKAFEAQQQERARRVGLALSELARFEAQGPKLQELSAAAAQAEPIAERWLSQRTGEPARVEALFERIHDARAEVVEARERAALAGCALLELSGVPPEAWPREP